jgi:hypothetical protein
MCSYNVLLQCVVTVCCYGVLLHCIVTLCCYIVLLQCVVTMCCCNVLLRCAVTLFCYSVLLQCQCIIKVEFACFVRHLKDSLCILKTKALLRFKACEGNEKTYISINMLAEGPKLCDV